jgi:hypothetical protein
VIAIRDNYPLVRFHDGSVMNYDTDWLASSVVRAAEVAGYKKWWLTPHVTASISNFLQQDFVGNTVTISRLEKAVQSVLQVIGYSDVARCFEPLPPPARLSLVEIARSAGGGYELVFFGLLRGRLQEILGSQARHVEISGLHESVKLLRNAKNWSNDCAVLLEEIVTFIRTEISTSQRAHELNLQLA